MKYFVSKDANHEWAYVEDLRGGWRVYKKYKDFLGNVYYHYQEFVFTLDESLELMGPFEV